MKRSKRLLVVLPAAFGFLCGRGPVYIPLNQGFNQSPAYNPQREIWMGIITIAILCFGSLFFHFVTLNKGTSWNNGRSFSQELVARTGETGGLITAAFLIGLGLRYFGPLLFP